MGPSRPGQRAKDFAVLRAKRGSAGPCRIGIRKVTGELVAVADSGSDGRRGAACAKRDNFHTQFAIPFAEPVPGGADTSAAGSGEAGTVEAELSGAILAENDPQDYYVGTNFDGL